jgi:hypothetical protein
MGATGSHPEGGIGQAWLWGYGCAVSEKGEPFDAEKHLEHLRSADPEGHCYEGYQPRALPLTKRVIDMAVGEGHTLAVTGACGLSLSLSISPCVTHAQHPDAGTVLSWGKNNWGQLGTGDLKQYSTAQRVPGLSCARRVIAGRDFSAVLCNKDFSTWCAEGERRGEVIR